MLQERSGSMFFICMLMPASISIITEKKIEKKEKNTSELILKYLFYTFLITTIMNSLIYIFSSDKMIFYSNSTFTYDFCLKYMWISMIIAFILPYILKVISVNINIDLEIKKKRNGKKKAEKKENTEKVEKTKNSNTKKKTRKSDKSN